MMKWIRDNDVILRVFSLIIAILLWTYVMDTKNPDKEVLLSDIPVHMQGISHLADKNLVILSGANSSADVRVSGTRNDILNLQEDLSALMLTASVEHISEPGEYRLNYIAEAKGFSGINIQSKNPKQIPIFVDRLSTVPVPVEVKLTGKPAAEHTISEYSVYPDAITVRGPATVLRQIKSAQVVYDVSGLSDSLQTNVTYSLLDEEGKVVENAFLSPETPSTTLNIDMKRSDEVSLTVSFTDCPYLNTDMVEAHIEPETIHLSGNPENMQGLNQISLANINLEDVLRNKTTRFERVIVLPNGVTADENQLQFAVVTLEFKDCGWMTVTADSSIIAPDPLFTYPEQVFEINLFGRDSLVENVMPNMITLEPVYDLNKITVGENIVAMHAVLQSESIYIEQNLSAIVDVTEEALQAAKDATAGLVPPEEPPAGTGETNE